MSTAATTPVVTSRRAAVTTSPSAQVTRNRATVAPGAPPCPGPSPWSPSPSPSVASSVARRSMRVTVPVTTSPP